MLSGLWSLVSAAKRLLSLLLIYILFSIPSACFGYNDCIIPNYGAISGKGETGMKVPVARKIFNVVMSAILLVVALFPIYWLVSLAFRDTAELSGNIPLFPKSFTLEHFAKLFTEKGYAEVLKNSLIATLISTSLSLAFGLAAAYVMVRARFRLKIKAPLTVWILLIRVLPPIAFIIPLYTTFSKLNLLGTRIPVILACVLINLPLIIWFMMTFFRDLPVEIEQSARLDGATEFQLLWMIVLPLVAPGIAAIAMISFMYAWNEYTYSVILIQKSADYTLPISLALLNTEDNLTQFGLVAAGGVISMIPITLFVIFAQNYLIAGLSSGAVKE